MAGNVKKKLHSKGTRKSDLQVEIKKRSERSEIGFSYLSSVVGESFNR